MAHIPRLHCETPIAPGPHALAGEQARHLVSVLRVRPGDELRLFSGDGREWQAVVEAVTRDRVHLAVGELARQVPPPAITIELAAPLIRAQRFETILEQCTEAGVDVIRPLTADHSARGDSASSQRADRWRKIVTGASEQSGRLFVPVLASPLAFRDLLAERSRQPLVIADATGVPLDAIRPLLPVAGTMCIAIGPEGGWSESELAAARAHGALVLRLGPNILRAETACVVAVAMLRAAIP